MTSFLVLAVRRALRRYLRSNCRGFIPEKALNLRENPIVARVIKDRLQEKTHGGILTGIPTQKIDEGKADIRSFFSDKKHEWSGISLSDSLSSGSKNA